VVEDQQIIMDVQEQVAQVVEEQEINVELERQGQSIPEVAVVVHLHLQVVLLLEDLELLVKEMLEEQEQKIIAQ
jgi:hypothetical protein